jgi:hypothetical protein
MEAQIKLNCKMQQLRETGGKSNCPQNTHKTQKKAAPEAPPFSLSKPTIA